MTSYKFIVTGNNEYGDEFKQHFLIPENQISGFVDDIHSKDFYRNFSNVTIELVDRTI